MAPDADATAGPPQGWHDLEAVLAEEPVARLLAAYLEQSSPSLPPVSLPMSPLRGAAVGVRTAAPIGPGGGAVGKGWQQDYRGSCPPEAVGQQVAWQHQPGFLQHHRKPPTNRPVGQ